VLKQIAEQRRQGKKIADAEIIIEKKDELPNKNSH
jgi:hypothetical protein